jgi:site-specific DNA-methyltransferase (adenine-specific)
MTKLRLINGDATKLPLPDKSVDLIITHPPYFGVDVVRYGGDPEKQINYSQNRKKMLKLLLKATKEMYRVLSDNGNLIIANGPTDNLDFRYILQTVDNTGFYYRDFIVQNSIDDNDWGTKLNEVVNSNGITIWHHFSKSDFLYNNPFSVKSNNSPVWNIPFNNISDPIDQKLAKNYHVFDVMNKEIPKRFISMFSKKGQVVLDPFGGSGLVATTAAEMGRMGISNDISASQTQAATERAKLSKVEIE